MRRSCKIFLLAALVVVLVIVVLLPRIGSYLVIDQELKEADLMVILMGSVPDRVLEAADVYQEGFAQDIVVVRSYREAEELLAERGVLIPGHADLTRAAAVELGIPAQGITVLPGAAASTKEEAQVITGYLQNNPDIETVMIVTSSYHTRRALIIFERYFREIDREITIISRAGRYDSFQPERWWEDRSSAKMIVLEYLKLTYFLAWEQW